MAVESGAKPPMLDIRPKAGPWMALPYVALRKVQYDPDGRPPLVIEFSSHIIEVEGRWLEGVYTAVVGHKARVLAEVQELYLEDGEPVPFIERLRVKAKRVGGRGGSAGPEDEEG